MSYFSPSQPSAKLSSDIKMKRFEHNFYCSVMSLPSIFCSKGDFASMSQKEPRPAITIILGPLPSAVVCKPPLCRCMASSTSRGPIS
jgi:hypothetical protein